MWKTSKTEVVASKDDIMEVWGKIKRFFNTTKKGTIKSINENYDWNKWEDDYKEELVGTIRSLLNSPGEYNQRFKELVVEEALTGRRKYAGSPLAVAEYLLTPTEFKSLKKPAPDEDSSDYNELIKKFSSEVVVDARGKGGRAGASAKEITFRLDVNPGKIATQVVNEIAPEGKELNEGILSGVMNLLKKGAEGVVQAIDGFSNWARNFFEKFVDLFGETIENRLNEAVDVPELAKKIAADPSAFFEFGEEKGGEEPPPIEENIMKEKKDLTKAKFSYKMLVETIQEEIEIMEQKNTLGADVNEILMGYYAGGENWNIYGSQAGAVQQAVEQRKAQISPEEYADQDGRAREQAKASLEWAAANGFDGKLVQTWWTARPGVLAKAVETEVDSKKNPTDTLYKFSSDAFLGVSAKSTKGKGEIGFKNPGIGSLGKSLGVDLVGVAKPKLIEVSEKLDWGDAKTAVARKQYLKDIGAYPMPKGSRTPTPAGEPYYSAGHQVLAVSRDALMKAYLDMPIEDLKEHFLDEWIDAKDRYPYYIKVTGHGKNGNYSASLMDPLNNDKLKKISSEHIELEDIGLSSIGVWAGEGADATKLFKIRFKWESSPLTSGLKLSGERF